MTTPSDKMRDALALTDHDRLELTHDVAASPDEHQGRGALELISAVLLLSASPALRSATAVEGFPGYLHRVAQHDQVVVIESEHPVVLLYGEGLPIDGGYALDARIGEAAALVLANGQEYVVQASHDHLASGQLERGAGALADWQPRAPQLGAPPLAEELLAGGLAAGWLQERLSELTSAAWPLDSVAVVGTVVRLWTPSERQAKLALLRGEARSPADRAREWAATLSPGAIADIERLAVLEATALDRDLDTLHELAAQDEPLDALVRHLVARRDALESVSSVLSDARAGAALRSCLALVDEHAEASLSELPCQPVDPSLEWLTQVAWQQPDAWWAGLVEA